jgi:L-ascorbate metabolism protein UlaG (beta-lactamase superfamily)
MSAASGGSWGRRLLAQPTPAAGVELTWLGQSGFVLRADGATLLLDPYLSPGDDRLVAPPDSADAFTGIDGVLITHEHMDHLDEDACRALAVASPDARFAVPRPIVDRLRRLGVAAERIVAMQPTDSASFGAATVTATAACHGVHVADAYTLGREESGGDVRFLGYVVGAGGVRVYHSGDTIDFDGLAETVRRIGADVARLPINGRTPEREAQDLVGNLGPEDAAGLAAAAGARVAIPTHYEMIAGNTGDPRAFVAAVATHDGLAALVPAHFAPVVLG